MAITFQMRGLHGCDCMVVGFITTYAISDLRLTPDTPVSSTNKIDLHNIAEILLKVALNTIT